MERAQDSEKSAASLGDSHGISGGFSLSFVCDFWTQRGYRCW